jgi:hypothetical protein
MWRNDGIPELCVAAANLRAFTPGQRQFTSIRQRILLTACAQIVESFLGTEKWPPYKSTEVKRMQQHLPKSLRIGLGQPKQTEAPLDQLSHFIIELIGDEVVVSLGNKTQVCFGRCAVFPVHLVEGHACVGQARIDSDEAPSIVDASAPLIERIDGEFHEAFLAFLKQHRHELGRIAQRSCSTKNAVVATIQPSTEARPYA